MISGVFFSVL
jgi:putative transposase